MSNRYRVSLAAARVISIALLLMVTICGECALAQAGNAPRTLSVTNPATGFTVRTTDGGITWEQVRSDGATGSQRMQIQQAAGTLGAIAWPNPASGATTVSYRLAQPAAVIVTLHDMQGNEVARVDEGAISAGEQAVSFDTTKLPDGTYYYRMTSDGTPGGGGLLVVAH
jgi:hypothetical protein